MCHPVESVAEVREEQVWHCAHRMQRVLAQRKALVGSGHAERTCAAFLDGSAGTPFRLGRCMKLEVEMELLMHLQFIQHFPALNLTRFL